MNADDEEQVETDDSTGVDFNATVPLTTDIDGSCAFECDSGDWSAEFERENLAVVKQEPDDVCYVLCATFGLLQQKELLEFLGNWCVLELFQLYRNWDNR